MYRKRMWLLGLFFSYTLLHGMFSSTYYFDGIKSFFHKVKAVFQFSNLAEEHVHFYDHAVVRRGNDLSDQERFFLDKRKIKTGIALEKIVGEKLSYDQCPRISLVMSGGGYRAMLGSIGFLLGAEKIGLLDAITYISTLSGSTWAVAPWIVTGMTLLDFKSYVCKQITQNITTLTSHESRLMRKMLFKRVTFYQRLTVVDIYGGLLANRLLRYFDDFCHLIHLSDLHQCIQGGDYPYPIFTAVDGRSAVAYNAPWFEFTPHEIGSADFGTYIPTWSCGRRFNAGKSIEFVPERSLGFQLGTYGSAFSVHLGKVWEDIASGISDSWFKRSMNRMVAYHGGRRIFWASIPNYMYGIKNQAWSSRRTLKLVDAGLAFNLPYPPVSERRKERKSDIVILCDMSAFNVGNALQSVEQYARKHHLKFPVIDYNGIEKRTISIFKDDTDDSVPIIIYIPRIHDQQLWQKKINKDFVGEYSSLNTFNIDECINQGYCKTTNFTYSSDQSQKIIDLMEFNVRANKDLILDIIRSAVDIKSKKEKK